MNNKFCGITRKMSMLGSFTVFFSLLLSAQDAFLDDTVKINEVIITSHKVNRFPSGYKIIRFDTALLNENSHESLSSVLARNTGISVKSYGLSGLSTPSFRGTGASHTLIQWNNIAINNPMLGQSDISLIPAGLFDEVEILSGGASMITGNGGIGGTINVMNKPSWSEGTFIVLNPVAGSFGRYTGLAKVKTGNSHFQSVTRAYLQYGKNDFTYINRALSSTPVKERMTNSESLGRGLVQELYFRRNRNSLSARMWYQNSDRNLPASILTGTASANETQFDESLRTVLNYEGNKGWSEYFLTASYNLANLNYTNKLASIYSDNKSGSLVFKAGFQHRLNNLIQARTIFEDENSWVSSVNYSDDLMSRNLFSLTMIAETRSLGRIDGSLVLKGMMDQKKLLVPDFSGGLQYRLSESQNYYIKGSYSRSTKVPTMNDLYWIPGGNSDLKNEISNSTELTLDMVQKISGSVSLKFNATLFSNLISNLIQWVPGPFTYWTAENAGKVSTMGAESAFSAEYSSGGLFAKIDFNYSLTKASKTASLSSGDDLIGKQLIYIPVHSANSSLHVRYNKFYSVLSSVYTGKRYTVADNSSYLPDYLINSITVGYEVVKNQNKYNIGFLADNFLNTAYESVAWYPQPGRSFALKINIQFKL